MSERIQIGDIVQHFKRELVDQSTPKYLYKIIDIAHHSETDEPMVVYKALYEPYKTCVRPYEMFMSEVDREKYPEISQKYRFEKVQSESVFDGAVYAQIEQAVREAGDILKNARLSADEIFQKEGPANFVTAFDVKIQEFLIDKFTKILPEATYFGEEETEGNAHALATEGYVFFIDPIDGTTNFLFDYDHSCISVGLALDGKMIAGFVFNPYSGKMYKAVRGKGAYVSENKTTCVGTTCASKMTWENCVSVSERKLDLGDIEHANGLADGVAEFGCARYNDDRLDHMLALIKKLFYTSLSIRNGGSAAIGISKVAAGSDILYFELKLQPYDYAAASVILEEAGGRICQFDGSPITLDKPCSIAAGTKKSVEEFLKIEAELN